MEKQTNRKVKYGYCENPDCPWDEPATLYWHPHGKYWGEPGYVCEGCYEEIDNIAMVKRANAELAEAWYGR